LAFGNVKKWGEHVLRGCESLDEIYFKGTDIYAVPPKIWLNVKVIKSEKFAGCFVNGVAIGSRRRASLVRSVRLPMLGLAPIDLVLDKQNFPQAVQVDKEVVKVAVAGRINPVRSIAIVGGWSSIADGTFEGMADLEEVEINETIKVLGDSVFRDCKRLRVAKLPQKLQTIGNSCFYGCSALCSISIPETVKDIQWNAFHSSGLVEVVLPKEMNAIDDSAFGACLALKRVKLPRKLGKLGQQAFSGGQSLLELELPAELGEVEGRVFAGSVLKKLIIGNIKGWNGKVKVKHCELIDGCTTLEEIISRGSDITLVPSGVWAKVKTIKSTKFAGKNIGVIVVESE
jgi:hypothetical protein